MIESLHDLLRYLSEKLGNAIIETQMDGGEASVSIQRDQLEKVMQFLRDDSNCRFKILIDIAGVDYPGRAERFEVVYQLLSVKHNQRLRVRLTADEVTPVPSLHDIYPNAVWYEREAYDLYGVLFADNPDLRRILTDYGFDGHPMRKDFPLTGYVEVRYDPEQQRVIYEPVKLTQEFRNFDFLSPWEGTDYVLPGDEKAQDESDEKGKAA